MPLRVAFDLDGVLADLDRAILDLASSLFAPAEPAPPPPGAGRSGGSPGQDAPAAAGPSHAFFASRGARNLVWDAVSDTENFWQTLGETEPGIVARLAAVARERKWEVVFLTQRPPTAGDPVEVQSGRWLERHGFPEPRVFVVGGSRGDAVHHHRVDAAVDDRVENCGSILSDSDARAVLVWRTGWGPAPLEDELPGAAVVPTTAAAIDWLAALPESLSPAAGETLA